MGELEQLQAIHDCVIAARTSRDEELNDLRLSLRRAEMRNKRLKLMLSDLISHGDACQWFVDEVDHAMRQEARTLLKFDEEWAPRFDGS